MSNIIQFNSRSSSNTNQPLTMSSREIAELLELRHDNVKRTMERLEGKGLISFTPMEELIEAGKGAKRKTTVYRVEKRDSFVVVAQLSPEFTAKIVDRWQELEEQAAGGGFKVPQNFREALLLAADQQYQIEEQQKALIEQAPKVEYHDTVLNTRNGMPTTVIAQELDVTTQTLNKRLYALGVQYPKKNLSGKIIGWHLFAEHLGKDYTVTTTRVFGADNNNSVHQMKWTEKGRKAIHALIAAQGF